MASSEALNLSDDVCAEEEASPGHGCQVYGQQSEQVAPAAASADISAARGPLAAVPEPPEIEHADPRAVKLRGAFADIKAKQRERRLKKSASEAGQPTHWLGDPTASIIARVAMHTSVDSE